MKKKFLAIAMALVMLLAMVPVVAQAEPQKISGTSNVYWELEGGKLTISGSGMMANYTGSTANTRPWNSQIASITNVEIQSGVTSIGSFAFASCSGLTSVTFEENSKLTSIEMNAFSSCSNLKEIKNLPTVTSIGKQAFSGCTKLADDDGFVILNRILYGYIGSATNVEIPNTVTSIWGFAFEGKTIKSVTIPSSVTSIEMNAFNGCSSLESVTIPNSVTSIGNAAFVSCIALTSVTIPESVTKINNSAFAGCSSLTSVTFEGTPTTLGSDVFASSAINSVTVPASGATSILVNLGTTAVGNLTELTITGDGAADKVAELNGTYNFANNGNIVVKANETVVYPAPTVGDIELTYMQGTLGWANEYTIGIKINDSSVTVADIVLKLEGASDALPKKTESEYETSRFTCYTVTENATYGYLFKIKIFARHLGTKINISVPEHTVMAWDGTIGESCGYSMVDYANLADYTDLATKMSEYAVEVAKLPTD